MSVNFLLCMPFAYCNFSPKMVTFLLTRWSTYDTKFQHWWVSPPSRSTRPRSPKISLRRKCWSTLYCETRRQSLLGRGLWFRYAIFSKKIASFIRGRLGYCCLIGCFCCYCYFHWWDREPHGSHFDGDVAGTSNLDCALKNRRSWFALMRWGCVSVYSIVPFLIDFPMREMKQEAYWITSLGFQLPWVGLDKTGCKYMKNNCTAETVGPNEVQPFSYPIQIMQAYPVVSFSFLKVNFQR